MNVATVQDAIVTRVATVLRCTKNAPDQVNPPQAWVQLPSIQPDIDFNLGVRATFPLWLVTGLGDSRTAQNALAGYMTTTGGGSIVAAFNADADLSGAVNSIRVAEILEPGLVLVGEQSYAGVRFNLEVIAD